MSFHPRRVRIVQREEELPCARCKRATLHRLETTRPAHPLVARLAGTADGHGQVRQWSSCTVCGWRVPLPVAPSHPAVPASKGSAITT